MKFNFSILIGAFLVVILPQAFASVPMAGSIIQYHDMDTIDIEILDVQQLFMDDTPGYSKDNADLLKVTVKVTNNGNEFFMLHDRMFRIWVMEPDIYQSTPENEVLEMVENYKTTYDMNLAVNYDNLQSRELFEECDYTNKMVHQNNSKTLTVCYEVLRIWENEALYLDGNKKYFLVMMDNYLATSCPNCKKEPLSYSKPDIVEFEMPPWVKNLFSWHSQGLISEKDFQNSLDFLQEQGIVTQLSQTNPASMSFEEKNQMLKEYQTKLAAALNTNLYVSASTFYESKYFDDFTGVLCRQQNNIVTLSGDYFNEDEYFDVIFFKLLLYDDFGDVVETGLSKITNVVPKEFRHFEVSAPYYEKLNHCLVIVDSKFNEY